MKDYKKDIKRLNVSPKQKYWDDMVAMARDSDFLEQLEKDAQVDDETFRYFRLMHQLHHGKVFTTVFGSNGDRYDILILSHNKYGCTCNDWRYKCMTEEQYRCKHLRGVV